MAFVNQTAIKTRSVTARQYPRVIASKTIYEMVSRMQVGQKVPPERQLAEMLSLSRKTIRAVLDTLEKKQVIKREQGRGTFVSSRIMPATKVNTEKAIIGAILPTVANHPMIAQIVQGIQSASRETGLELKIFDTGHSTDRQIECLRSCDSENIKGLIIYPYDTVVYEPEFVRSVRRHLKRDISVVMIDRYLPEIDTCYVSPDYYRAGYIAIRHLIMLGHRRILNLSMARAGGTTGVTILRGCIQALRDYGIDEDEELIKERRAHVDFIENGYQILKTFLSSGKHLPFTAIYSACEGSAYGAYTALKEHGLDVPRDIAMVSSDNVNMPAYDIGWTAVTYPWEEIGRKTVALLEHKISGSRPSEQHNEHVILPVSLTIRRSCGRYQGTGEFQNLPSDETKSQL